MPVSFETSSSLEPMPPMRKFPSGWWILPAIIVGFCRIDRDRRMAHLVIRLA
jgi:hypothetical protein